MKLLLAILIVVAATNCNSAKTLDKKEEVNQTKEEPSGTYVVNLLNGKNISDQELTLKFDNRNNNLSGFSGCNIYRCSYKITEDSFKIGIPGASKRYCENTMDLETKFFEALSTISKYEYKENAIHFMNQNNDLIMTATKPE